LCFKLNSCSGQQLNRNAVRQQEEKKEVMVFRFTQKLSKKLKINPQPECDYGVSPMEEWYGHLFIANRLQYILFTNAYSLYSIIFPGKGIITMRNFMDVGFSVLDEELKDIGSGIIMEKYITPNTSTIDICKTNNRSILGSMNDMVNMSKSIFALEDSTINEVMSLLNRTPFSYLKYGNPRSILEKYISDKNISYKKILT